MNIHRFNMNCTHTATPCVYPELAARTGQDVEVLAPVPVDPETDPLWRVRFADGFEADAFDYELT
jgi:hypothetical protein